MPIIITTRVLSRSCLLFLCGPGRICPDNSSVFAQLTNGAEEGSIVEKAGKRESVGYHYCTPVRWGSTDSPPLPRETGQGCKGTVGPGCTCPLMSLKATTTCHGFHACSCLCSRLTVLECYKFYISPPIYKPILYIYASQKQWRQCFSDQCCARIRWALDWACLCQRSPSSDKAQ